MSLFRRVLRFLFLLAGIGAGILTAVAAIFSKRLVRPPRQRQWATPGDLGLAYEDVQFPARDGVRLAGWFVPATDPTRRKGAAITVVHGWAWNRLGDAAEDPTATFLGNTPVDLLRLIFALQQDGFHVFSFDLRNHGESAETPPFTFGQQEANDLLGALDYLQTRDDVSGKRLGVVGFSTGANTVLYALPQTDQVRAAIAVQPTTPALFAGRLGAYLLGPLGAVTVAMVESMYQVAGGTRFGAYRPAFAAAGAGAIPVLYVQGKGDRWGSMEDVAHMAANTPQAQAPLFVDSMHRSGGYQYLIDNPKVATAFFEQHLPE